MSDGFQTCAERLWQSMRLLSPHERYRGIVEALQFEPGASCESSFAIGPFRAEIAAAWECLFEAAVPIVRLRRLVADRSDLDFRAGVWKLAESLSGCEFRAALVFFMNWLRRKVAVRARQQLLVPGDVTEQVNGSIHPLVRPRVVGSLEALIAAGQRFATIYADPPWAYNNRASRGAATNHYGVMTVDEICREPVEQLAAENAHLHLWTTNAFLRPALRVIDAWGFRYKSCFVWAKEQIGMGNYWRVSHEFLLLGVRGRLPFADRTERSWRTWRRSIHSRKPAGVRLLIERVSPAPYLELYGREEFPDCAWTVYGNEVERRLF